MRNMQDEDGYLTFYGYDKNGKLRAIHYKDGRGMCVYLLDYTKPYHNLPGVETEKYLWNTESHILERILANAIILIILKNKEIAANSYNEFYARGIKF